MEFSRQEYWSGLPCPPPGELPDPGIEPVDGQQILYLLSHQDFLYNTMCLLLNKDGEKKRLKSELSMDVYLTIKANEIASFVSNDFEDF